MKDKARSCQHKTEDGAIYKEVVVIGNGPSGMVTSFMLAGNVPYLKKPIPDDLPIDDMLRARLNNLPEGQSLYETDLLDLAEGLEGRSQNPIPLLMDNLLRPCTDLEIDADPLIEWKFEINKKIPHVVLGALPPGGTWRAVPGTVRALSPAHWLVLPPHRARPAPAPAAAVRGYCARYVARCGLTKYFRNGVVVTDVSQIHNNEKPCDRKCPMNARWKVTGYDGRSNRLVTYVSVRVTLAGGGGARPRGLRGVRAAVTDLAGVERAAGGGLRDLPVLIVGSGVSAADAVLACWRRKLTVALVHRDPAPALAGLSPSMYPDYVKVYKMMCEGASAKCENYIPFPEHVILKVRPDENYDVPQNTDDPKLAQAITPKRVKLLNVLTNETVDITVSFIAVLIGSKPDLSFLKPNFDLNYERNYCNKCCEIKHIKKEDKQRLCFLKNHWHYIKSFLGQCKNKYVTDLNGNDEKCVPDCNNIDEFNDDKENIELIPNNKNKCQCAERLADGIGFGVDPTKPVDCRSNPLAIDKSSHELLNAPKGLYALGPLTADNFIRFIPGGALALVSHIHKERQEIK